MTRIALEARALSTLGGGVRTYTREVISRLLASHSPYNFQVYYDSPRFLGTFPDAPERAIPVGHPLLRLFWDFWSLPRAVEKDAVDLLHYFKPATSPWLRVRAVATVYDVIPLLYPETQTVEQRWYWRVQLPLVAKKCEQLLTISESSKRDIVRCLQISPERVTVTPLGVSERFRPASESEVSRVRARLKLPQTFFLSLGTIEPRKNVARLVRAYARICTSVPHDLVIAGKWGWKFTDVLQALRDPRVHARVRVLSHVAQDDLPALYSAADVFAFPSFYEGFGLPPLEALACGTPVVASSVSSIPEAVGSHALLMPPEHEEALADALKRLALDRALHDRLRGEGMTWARGFTWERTVSQTVAVYERLLR